MCSPTSRQPSSPRSSPARTAQRVATPRVSAMRAPAALQAEARNVMPATCMLLRRTITIAVLALIPLAGCRRTHGGFGAGLPEIGPTRADDQAKAAPEDQEPGAVERLSVETGFAPVVDRVAGAVVNVSSTRVLHPPAADQNPFFDDPLFRQFFGHGGARPPHEMREQALGSGVIVSRDGYVLTNAHVVHGASEVRVMLPDKREFKAKIVRQDPKTDIALVRIPAGDYTVARSATRAACA